VNDEARDDEVDHEASRAMERAIINAALAFMNYAAQ
jgi:hypothetical protein